MFRDKINLRLQKGGSVEPPRTPPVYGPDYDYDCDSGLKLSSLYTCSITYIQYYTNNYGRLYSAD